MPIHPKPQLKYYSYICIIMGRTKKLTPDEIEKLREKTKEKQGAVVEKPKAGMRTILTVV